MKPTGGKISKEEFEKMHKKYKDKNPGKTESVLFDSTSISNVINAPGAAGMRVYFGEDAEGRLTVMMRPTDDSGVALSGDDPTNRGQLCPPNC